MVQHRFVGARVLSRRCNKDGSAPAKTVRVSMIPTTDPGKMLRESAPFVEYVEHAAKAKVDLTIPMNYAAVVEALVNETVDIAQLGGFTYVQASSRGKIVPLVQ